MLSAMRQVTMHDSATCMITTQNNEHTRNFIIDMKDSSKDFDTNDKQGGQRGIERTQRASESHASNNTIDNTYSNSSYLNDTNQQEHGKHL